MCLVVDFEKWQEDKKLSLEDENGDFPCPDCDGRGEIECDCDCPRCESEYDCQGCDGSGVVKFNELFDYQKEPLIGFHIYFNEAIASLKEVAVWANKDFFKLAGDFIKKNNGRRN